MKKQFLIALMSVFFILPVAAKDIKISFHVNGKCGMCEERIENALDIKGIKFADWSKETKMCTVKFNPDIISEKEIMLSKFSSVPIIFGPNSDMDGVMYLVKFEGKWYLAGF